MLVLSRKTQQSIRIGESITVTIVRIKGNTVRVGIEAPESIKIMRGELPDFSSSETESMETEAEVEGMTSWVEAGNTFVLATSKSNENVILCSASSIAVWIIWSTSARL